MQGWVQKVKPILVPVAEPREEDRSAREKLHAQLETELHVHQIQIKQRGSRGPSAPCWGPGTGSHRARHWAETDDDPRRKVSAPVSVHRRSMPGTQRRLRSAEQPRKRDSSQDWVQRPQTTGNSTTPVEKPQPPPATPPARGGSARFRLPPKGLELPQGSRGTPRQQSASQSIVLHEQAAAQLLMAEPPASPPAQIEVIPGSDDHCAPLPSPVRSYPSRPPREPFKEPNPLSKAELVRSLNKWLAALQPGGVKKVQGQKKPMHKHKIVLLTSIFEDRPPTLLFRYSPAATGGVQRCLDRAVTADILGEDADVLPKMYYCHTEEVHPYNSVLNTLKLGGLYKARGGWLGKCVLIWGAQPKVDMLRSFHAYQKTNHFPLSWHLGNKDLLWRGICRLRRRVGPACEITPQGYVLPDESKPWAAAREQNPKAAWIFKPVNSSCGRGIRVLTSQISRSVEDELVKRGGIVQRYITNPLTVNGYKFDLRIYVVVASYDPLRIYLNDEGLARFATEKYSASPKTLSSRTMHLTNYSVNKHSTAYVKNTDGKDMAGSAKAWCEHSSPQTWESSEGPERSEEGAMVDVGEEVEAEEAEAEEDGPEDGMGEAGASKWSLQQLRVHFEQEGLDFTGLMARIEDLAIKTVLAAEPEIVTGWHQGLNFTGSVATASSGVGWDDAASNGDSEGEGRRWPNQTCFEIYGFDVLVDEALKPWLLEVNVSPSLSSSSPFDKRVKTKLVADSLTLVGLRPFDYLGVEREVREERLSRLRGLQPRKTQPSAMGKIQRTQELLFAQNSQVLKIFTEFEWQLILETHEEFMRSGSLQRIFPTEQNAAHYASMFAVPRYSNLVLRRWLEAGGPQCFLPGAENPAPPWVPKQIQFSRT